MPERRKTAFSYILNSSFVAQQHIPARRPKDLSLLVLLPTLANALKNHRNCSRILRSLSPALFLEWYWKEKKKRIYHLQGIFLIPVANTYCSTLYTKKGTRNIFLECNLSSLKLMTCKANLFWSLSRDYYSRVLFISLDLKSQHCYLPSGNFWAFRFFLLYLRILVTNCD